MIVPRAFAAHRAELGEKKEYRSTRPRNASRSRSPFRISPSSSPTDSPLRQDARSLPVTIPSRASKQVPQPARRPAPVVIQPDDTVALQVPKPRKESTQELLSATAIPIRRKLRGRPSQRLPKGDHVADFSRLLLDDLKPASDGSLPRSVSNSHLEGLFGGIDELMEGQMIVGSEGVDESVLTVRSASSDSLASLASPDDYGTSAIGSHQSSVARSFGKKSPRRVVSSEDCVADHPLIHDDEDAISESGYSTPTPWRAMSPPATEKKPNSFKSSLTASLKALKSAAQSVSYRASSFSSPSPDFMARSFFDIEPSLTDDRRPPPTSALPSPELRRYLNPRTSSAPPDSPAQLHIWHEDRHASPTKAQAKTKSKSKKKSSRNPVDNLPAVVPLATCLPPSIRTAHASSPPIWLAPDGTPSNKQTANHTLTDSTTSVANGMPITRSREPRENRDFLRVFVCEMEMRRSGKLNDDLSAGRARLWLPPVVTRLDKPSSGSEISESESEAGSGSKQTPPRWRAWTAEEL